MLGALEQPGNATILWSWAGLAATDPSDISDGLLFVYDTPAHGVLQFAIAEVLTLFSRPGRFRKK